MHDDDEEAASTSGARGVARLQVSVVRPAPGDEQDGAGAARRDTWPTVVSRTTCRANPALLPPGLPAGEDPAEDVDGHERRYDDDQFVRKAIV